MNKIPEDRMYQEQLMSVEKELERLGVDLNKIERDSASSYFNVDLNASTLKANGYKPIRTGSGDPTFGLYTNGTWVIGLSASSCKHIDIYRLGKKARETIANGEEFDIYNQSLEESKGSELMTESYADDYVALKVNDERLGCDHRKRSFFL